MEVQNAAPISDVDTSINVTTSGPSFDDFDRVEEVKKDIEEKATKKAKKSEKAEENKSEDQKKQDDKVPAPDKIEEETPEEKKTDEKATEEVEPSGDEIEVKVNGKVEKVKLEDLKANYSGKVAYDKKFTELDKERKSFQQEKEAAYRPILEFKRLLQEGKAGDAILHLVDMAGEDSYNFNKKLIAAMTPMVKARLEMTPEQLEAYEARSELDHLKKKEQSQLERSKAEQTQKDFDQRIAKLQETHSISDDDFRTAAVKLRELLEANGKFKADEFTPEAVANFHQAKIYSGKVFKAIESVDKSLESDSVMINELINLMFDEPGISHEDLVSIIREHSGINAKLKVLTEKSQVEKRTQAASTPAKQSKPEFFSDYDE